MQNWEHQRPPTDSIFHAESNGEILLLKNVSYILLTDYQSYSI